MLVFGPVIYCLNNFCLSITPLIQILQSLTMDSDLFFLMFLSTCSTSKVDEIRSNWHSGYWILKSFLLIASMAVPFFLPSDYMQIYGKCNLRINHSMLMLQACNMYLYLPIWQLMEKQSSTYIWEIGAFSSSIYTKGA